MFEVSRRGVLLAPLAAGLMASVAKATAVGETPLSDEAIAAVLRDFVDVRRQSLGLAVGVVTPAGTRVVGHGVLNGDDPRRPDADTVFDIASTTKTFTGLLLADAVRRGEVHYDDPVARYLPAGVRMPTRGGRQITLIDLATHTSGLPFELQNANDPAFARAAEANPMGPLYDLLRTVELDSDIGSTFAYSNLGYGLLGEALGRRAGIGYEALLSRRILRPLGMTSTGLSLTPAMLRRRARPHTETLAAGVEWNKPWGRPAGGLKSTVRDLSAYLAAYVGLARTPLAPAMADTLHHLRPAAVMSAEVGLGWFVRPGAQPIAWFGGLGPGFASGIAYDRQARTAVVVLSNARPPVVDLGLHVLRPSLPLIPPPPVLAPDASLDPLVGRYRLLADLPAQRIHAGDIVEIRRGPNGLIVGTPGGASGPLTRQSETRFAISGYPLAVEFHGSDRLTMTFQGTPIEAERVR